MGEQNVRWHRVANRATLVPNEPLAVEIDGKLIGVYLVGDAVHAIGNLCTHEYAILTDGFVEGDVVECPIHQARFSITSGKALSEPAVVDVPTYPVKVEGDDVFVGV